MKYLRLLLVAAVWPAASAQTSASGVVYKIETVAGSSSIGDAGPATAAQIGNIQGIAIDRLGNLYLSDTDKNRVRKIDTAGIITTIAGTGAAGFGGDGGPAAAAQLNLPYGLAADLAGNLYVADLGNNRVRRIAPDGSISTLAGTGVKGSTGDGGAASAAQLFTPRNVAADAAGNLYISEFEGQRVRKVTPDGKISTIAGTGVAGFRGDGGLATNAQIGFPAGIAVDRTGALFIADSQSQRIRKILPGGIISTVLGGSTATALLTPIAVAVDISGDIYVADASDAVHCYTPAGKWNLAAGTGAPGFAGDGGPAAKALLTAPRDLAVDLYGDLFIADGGRVREVNPSANILTVAGDGYTHAVGDGGPATAALLYQPMSVALDNSGNLYIADPGTQRVRQVAPSGIIGTLAGTGTAGYNKDQIPAATAQLSSPMGVAASASGNIFIADSYNHRIREVAPNGMISTFAGTGTGGIGPEDLPPAQTQLRGPQGICISYSGTVYIADTANYRVLRAAPNALVETAAGNGSPGNAGDGGQARVAQLNQPAACAADSAGNLLIADTSNNRVVKVTPAGVIATIAGTGQAGAGGDGGPAASASLNGPRGVAVDGNGDIFIADTGNNRIREVTPDGTIQTIAGQSVTAQSAAGPSPAGFSGDGGSAAAALLNAPGGLFLDGSGNLYFADTNNNRVRRLVAEAAPVVVVTPPVKPPSPVISLVSAASLAQGAIAPGEIVTIAGSGIGPEAGVPGVTDATGLLSNLLAGTEVRFDGLPAPLLYVQSSQINAQAPYSIAGQITTHVEVFYQGQSAGSADVPVTGAAPSLFPVVMNQDGTLNAQGNPAVAGTILTFYATGEGLTDGSNVSGQLAQAPYAHPLLPVALTVAGAVAQLLYAGSAPAMVGMLQVNAQIPDGTASGTAAVTLSVGTANALAVNIWVQ